MAKTKQSEKTEVEQTEVEQTEVGLTEAGQTDTDQTVVSLICSMTEQINEAYGTIRALKSGLKVLERQHKREIKLSRKNRKSHNANKGQKKPSGFNKPGPVPATIIKLLNLEEGVELPRTKVTKLIYGYIKDHELQVPEDKRTINPDKKLRKLFGLAKGEQISFYNIQTHIKKLYPTKTTETETVSVSEPVEVSSGNEKGKSKSGKSKSKSKSKKSKSNSA